MKSAVAMKVTVFGTGYVGLVTGVCLADIGHDVVCVDTDVDKVALLRQGISPIYERGMNELLAKNIVAKRILFATDLQDGVLHGDYQFIAVGTPSTTDGSADLTQVYSVARTIGQFLVKPCVIVNKSTVPVGVGDEVKAIVGDELAKRDLKINFDIVSNPEFLKQGDAIKDFMHADRIIVGADCQRAENAMQQLYSALDARIIFMDLRSAELSKYAANAFLAMKISFINEIAQFAEYTGADVAKIRAGIGADRRIGLDFLQAGCGYGGSCFPKDVKALIQMAQEYGMESSLLHAVENINFRQKQIIFNELKKYLGDLDGKVIALWGLAFKPNTDDMRDAPSKTLLELLWQAGAKVQAYDPIAMGEARRIYGDRSDFILYDNASLVLNGADVLVIVTEWDEFKQPDFAVIKSKLRYAAIFDGRNLFAPDQMAELAIDYFCIGRPLHVKNQ